MLIQRPKVVKVKPLNHHKKSKMRQQLYIKQMLTVGFFSISQEISIKQNYLKICSQGINLSLMQPNLKKDKTLSLYQNSLILIQTPKKATTGIFWHNHPSSMQCSFQMLKKKNATEEERIERLTQLTVQFIMLRINQLQKMIPNWLRDLLTISVSLAMKKT